MTMRGRVYTSAHFLGRVKWTPDQVEKLKAMCVRQASWDDLNAAFPGWGQGTIMVGMRGIIAELADQLERRRIETDELVSRLQGLTA